jgi:hypothetical protein
MHFLKLIPLVFIILSHNYNYVCYSYLGMIEGSGWLSCFEKVEVEGSRRMIMRYLHQEN